MQHDTSKPTNPRSSKPPSGSYLNLSNISNESLVIHEEENNNNEPFHSHIEEESDEELVYEDSKYSNNMKNPNFFHTLSLKFYGNEAEGDKSPYSENIYEIESEIGESSELASSYNTNGLKKYSQDDGTEAKSLTDLTTGRLRGKRSFSKSQHAAFENLFLGEKGKRLEKSTSGFEAKTLLLNKGKKSWDIRAWNLVKNDSGTSMPLSKFAKRLQNKSAVGQSGLMKVSLSKEDKEIQKNEVENTENRIENSETLSYCLNNKEKFTSFVTAPDVMGTFMSRARRTKVTRNLAE